MWVAVERWLARDARVAANHTTREPTMASIKCGNCHNTHESAADVRACYEHDAEGHAQQQAEIATEQRYERWLEDGGAAHESIQADLELDRMHEDPEDPWLAANRANAANAATDRQIAYIKSLQEERLPEDQRLDDVRLAAITKAGASAMIESLKKRPVLKPTTKEIVNTVNVPAGRYAVEDNGTLKFYKVDVPGADSRWYGRTFVKVQASDNEYPVKGEGARRVLTLIARDPQAAMLRYGREIGSCGHCGRTLTNEESRERGIGPICAGKMGW